jgi:exopolyphosphatase/guanosine-5'-triphosphate,3'-diphosphate pyrophosphatase
MAPGKQNARITYFRCMAKQVAVMDLGTNTFHLLIAEGSAENYTEIVHEHDSVRLGEGGINKGIIQPSAYQRGLDTMQKFKADIDGHGVKVVRAIATSALRNASNGQQFINEVAEKTNIQIELIDGEQEAEYIYKGVKLAGSLADQTSLIMDIGGGSVEFILGNANSILWKQSFEIGAARLMDKFHQTDPIPAESVDELNLYLREKLTCLLGIAQKHPVDALIGSSGAFETFAEVIERDKGNDFSLDIKNYNFALDDLISVTDKLITSSHQQRKEMHGIIPIRVDMIVVASLITRFILSNLKIEKVCMSTYSLKEGVLAEMMDD